jgi:lactate dehydrogenase-like 2-hydroxyacid dehydrogenase
MSYNDVLLKDKADIVESVIQRLPGVQILGAYEKPQDSYPNVKVLSVKFSKVGKQTLNKFPNLEWIVCRSHGVDMVNLKDAREKNIGVVALAPTAIPCANWIKDKIKDDDAILIFGNGSISREVQKYIGNFNVVNSKTSQEEIDRYLAFCKTIIIALPLNDDTKNYFDTSLFSKIRKEVDIISLSRGEVISNPALVNFIASGKLRNGHFDMLATEHRNNIVQFPNVKYYEHVAWSYNQPIIKGKVGGYVNSNFADDLKTLIDNCKNNQVEEPHLKRHERVWF